jgi:hypothetical protein
MGSVDDLLAETLAFKGTALDRMKGSGHHSRNLIEDTYGSTACNVRAAY